MCCAHGDQSFLCACRMSDDNTIDGIIHYSLTKDGINYFLNEETMNIHLDDGGVPGEICGTLESGEIILNRLPGEWRNHLEPLTCSCPQGVVGTCQRGPQVR